MNDLIKYLAGRFPKGFKPRPRRNEGFACVEWYWEDEPAYEEPVHVDGVWVGSVVRSRATDRAVGVKIFEEAIR